MDANKVEKIMNDIAKYHKKERSPDFCTCMTCEINRAKALEEAFYKNDLKFSEIRKILISLSETGYLRIRARIVMDDIFVLEDKIAVEGGVEEKILKYKEDVKEALKNI